MGASHEDVTPNDTTDHWYHENTLTIRGDSAFLQKVPVVIRNGVKAYSASDGGFYEFRGKIKPYPDSLVAHFLLASHDYVLLPYRVRHGADAASTLSFEEQVKRGMLVLDSSYVKKSYHLILRAERIAMDGVEYTPMRH